MNKQNLHTHSTFCDGADTPEEMVLSAIEKGFDSLGFSGHSYMSYSPMFREKGDRTEEYKTEVKRLREKYKDQIEIYLGLEVEMYSDADMTGFDYLIGSAHYFKFGDKCVAFDLSADGVEKLIENRFSGNGMKFALAYYETLAKLPEYGKFDIIGHFDLATKHNESRNLFDCNAKEYLGAAFETARALQGKIPFFEVNTGAIGRAYRTTPYPAISILKELKRLGFGAVITSDCHRKEALDCYYEESRELLRECGFRERYILTDNGFKAVEI